MPNEATIDVRRQTEVDYWSRALGVTEPQLRVAVAQAGTSVSTVSDALKQHAQRTAILLGVSLPWAAPSREPGDPSPPRR